MSGRAELCVGITTWNDADAIELCLDSLAHTLQNVRYEIEIVDNGSADGTVELARSRGAHVVVRDWSQSDALNHLLLRSEAPYTLLLHSDVVLLADDWYPRVVAALDERTILVAPEDIGAGPFLRADIGAGMPESSFLFWRTADAKRLRQLLPRHLLRAVPRRLPLRAINLYHLHVTHYIPELLERRGLRWRRMDVLPSPAGARWFELDERLAGATWSADWGALAYGFGNFYALDGAITHYHQWYARRSAFDSTGLNDDGVPVAYLDEAAARFARDYAAGTVKLP